MKRWTLRAIALSVAAGSAALLAVRQPYRLESVALARAVLRMWRNSPIVGRLGRVPELGTYCGHRHVGVFVKCPQENGVLVTEGAVETAAPQTGHCEQVIERCAGHTVRLRARPAHRRHRGGRRLCRSQPGRQVAR